MADTESKTKKKSKSSLASYKDNVEIHPELDNKSRTIRLESKQILSEVLSRAGRLRLSRAMKKRASSGKLLRGRKRMAARAMTSGRAKGLGWRGARRQIKQGLAKGKNYSSLDVASKARIEKIASRKVAKRKVLARQITKARLRGESFKINTAFEYMIEGKRYHQLLNKNGAVKFDMRFKHFKPKAEAEMNMDDVMNVVSHMNSIVDQNCSVSEAAVVAYASLLENNKSSYAAYIVSKQFNIDKNDLIETYNLWMDE